MDVLEQLGSTRVWPIGDDPLGQFDRFGEGATLGECYRAQRDD